MKAKANENNIGKSIFDLLGKDRAPWSVGTTAIISGLGLRLINIAFKASNNMGFYKEVEVFFQMCDRDDLLFTENLQHKHRDLNEVPLQLIKQINLLLSKLLEKNYQIKENVEVDYYMGIDYLICAGNQTLKIIEANQFFGITKKDFLRLKEELEIIRSKYQEVKSSKETS